MRRWLGPLSKIAPTSMRLNPLSSPDCRQQELIRIGRNDMNRRRQFFRTIGLGSLPAGGAAAAPREEFAATAKSRRTPSLAPKHRAEYKIFTVAAGDSVEDVFNALARESFQYAGPVQRYGHTEFIFVKWMPIDPTASGYGSS
jgi:hypothetical protein